MSRALAISVSMQTLNGRKEYEGTPSRPVEGETYAHSRFSANR